MRENGWVGVHKCGGLLEAVPNTSAEVYRCSVHTCSNSLSEDDHFVFKNEDLPKSVNPMVVKSMSREHRQSVAECDSKDEAKNRIQKLVNNGSVKTF